MISLRSVNKTYHTRTGAAQVLRDIDLDIAPGDKLAVLGRNGAGKSTLFRILTAVERQSSGEIIRDMSISWPLAFTGAFQGTLTGIDNTRFVSRVYDVDFDEMMAFVEDFTELGKYLYEPVRVYSSGMRARLAFALSMAIEFDCYVIDEVAAVGDVRFQAKCQRELYERRADRAMVIASHDTQYLRTHCNRGGVLFEGILHLFDDIDDAIAFHEARMAQ